VLQNYRPPELRVSVDGQGGYRGAWVVVTNTRNYGGLFTLADSARIDSGTLEVLLFSRAGFLDLVGVGLAGFTGGGVSRLPGVTCLSGREIRIEAGGEVDIEVDGDHWGKTPATILLRPATVPLLVPA
jgi:diacylglycerol kinase family enzyme